MPLFRLKPHRSQGWVNCIFTYKVQVCWTVGTMKVGSQVLLDNLVCGGNANILRFFISNITAEMIFFVSLRDTNDHDFC